MSVPAFYEDSFRIRSYEVEPDGRLRLVTLARLLQEMAWQHARRLGWGLIDREEGSLFWVLSRLRVAMERYPYWGDELTIRTWPVGTQRVLAVREFSLSDSSGVLGRCSTGWLVVDESTGRLVRPQEIVSNVTNSPSEFPGDLKRISELKEGETVQDRDVLHHDIDRYRHVNNSAYLEWMLDAIAAQAGDEARIPSAERLEIDFLKELRLGETFRSCIHATGAITQCEVQRADDSEVMCRARFHWKEGNDAVHDGSE